MARAYVCICVCMYVSIIYLYINYIFWLGIILRVQQLTHYSYSVKSALTLTDLNKYWLSNECPFLTVSQD